MPDTPLGMRICPTRADGEAALFAHVIPVSTCQDRQRGYFHKCPSCSHRNGAPLAEASDLIPRPQLPELARSASGPAALPRSAQGA